MNNENQQEQETKEQQTGNFWKDKMLPWLKELCLKICNGLKKWWKFVVMIVLQLVFFIMNWTFKVRIANISFLSVSWETMKLFKGGFHSVLWWLGAVLLIMSVLLNLLYLLNKRVGVGCRIGKWSILFMLVSFAVLMIECLVVVNELGEKFDIEIKELMSFNGFNLVCYIIVGIITFIWVSNMSEREKTLAIIEKGKRNQRIIQEIQRKAK